MQRQTPQRLAIKAALAGIGRPLTPLEILDVARVRVPSLNLATVYRTLRRMGDAGEIAPVELPGEPPRYQPREAAEHHHHHFRCTTCHAVFNVEGCVEGLKKLLPKGFRMTAHDIVLYGLCRSCAV